MATASWAADCASAGRLSSKKPEAEVGQRPGEVGGDATRPGVFLLVNDLFG